MKIFLAALFLLTPYNAQANLVRSCNLSISSLSVDAKTRERFTEPKRQNPGEQNWSEFFKDVYTSRGSHLFLKWDQTGEPELPQDQRWHGLWQKSPVSKLWFSQAPITWTVQLLPRLASEKIFDDDSFDLHPLNFQKTLINELLAKAPLESGQRLELSKLSILFLDGVMISFAYGVIDWLQNHRVEGAITEEADKNPGVWDELIKYDYRYHDFVEELKTENASPRVMRVGVIALHKAFSNYYGFMAGQSQANFKKEFKALSKNVLFKDITDLKPGIKESAPAYANYLVHSHEPLTDAQVRRLYTIRNFYYAGAEIISQWVHSGYTFTKAPKMLDRLLATAYAKKLLSLRSRLTPLQVQFLLQKSLYISTKFLEWQTLNIEPLMVGEGVVKNSVLTLQMVSALMDDQLDHLDTLPQAAFQN